MEGPEFEDEVRRIARELWPEARYSGASVVGGKERDAIFETEDVIHIIECTTQRTKAKAEDDGRKLAGLKKKLEGSKPVVCWFVTETEPTAEQRSAVPKMVKVLSFDQFRSRLVDANGYLRDRSKYSFGSARDPESGRS